MHTRQRIVLHGVLAVAAIWMAWRLAAEWGHANLRYQVLAQARAQAAAPLLPSLSSRPLPPAQEIVGQNLFSPDRNNNAAQEEKAATPPPPVPVVFGTMKLGADYEALLAERGSSAGSGFQRVKQGEQFSGYTVVEIRDEKVVLEFAGQKTTVDVYRSANSVPRPAGAAPAAAPAAPMVEKTSAQPPPSPPPSTSPAVAAPAAAGAAAEPTGNPYETVTIEGNRRKIVLQTPFGPMIRYEDIR
ncbi:MAG: hypothetical protein HY648_13040 [Acidobacteria bacterium]|nr:hypothetical protein [Acidobacteriota bacterium]